MWIPVLRIVGLVVLLLLSVDLDPLPGWWWATLIMITAWTILDLRRLRDDDDNE